jgi:hypothetical protein
MTAHGILWRARSFTTTACRETRADLGEEPRGVGS